VDNTYIFLPQNPDCYLTYPYYPILDAAVPPYHLPHLDPPLAAFVAQQLAVEHLI